MTERSWWQHLSVRAGVTVGHKALTLALLWVLAGPPGQASISEATQRSFSSYRSVSVEQILADPSRYIDALVLASGRYEPVGEPRWFLEGVLTGVTGARLRVMGPVFDWVPQAFSCVEFWGRIRQDELGPYLYFFNGRLLGQTDRRPYVMPSLADGRAVTLVAMLRQVGSGPFIHWVLQMEDRRTIEVLRFPAGFRPVGGLIVEATGVVRMGGIPPVVAGMRVERIRVMPGRGPLPFGADPGRYAVPALQTRASSAANCSRRVGPYSVRQ